MTDTSVGRFGSIEPDEYKTSLMGSMNSHFHVLELFLNNVKDSREKSLALTKLEEASMWCNKAVARGEIHTREEAPSEGQN